MAEVDIICDASQQAHAKLNGAEALLAATGALSEATADVTLRRCKAKKAASDASPVLHATRPGVPKWMRRHILCEDDAEGCYPCRLAPVMSVTVVRYLNLRAQCLHLQGNREDAHAHFDESVRVLGLVTERLRTISYLFIGCTRGTWVTDVNLHHLVASFGYSDRFFDTFLSQFGFFLIFVSFM